MAAVDLEAEEMKEFEYYRLIGGFPPNDKEALALFRGIKAYASASDCGNAVKTNAVKTYVLKR